MKTATYSHHTKHAIDPGVVHPRTLWIVRSDDQAAPYLCCGTRWHFGRVAPAPRRLESPVSIGMAEVQDTVPGDIPIAEVLANTVNFNFRVEKMPNGNYCVCADSFPIKEYPSEEQAHAFCNRLTDYQSRESLKGAWKRTEPVAFVPLR